MPGKPIVEDSTRFNPNPGQILADNLSRYAAYKTDMNRAFASLHSNHTCIIKALNGMVEEIAVRDRHHTKYGKKHLIVMSDMLEACTTHSRFINLENNYFKAADSLLAEWPADKKYFSGLNDMSIDLVFNTSKAADYPTLVDFWRTYFKVTGYSSFVGVSTGFTRSILEE